MSQRKTRISAVALLTLAGGLLAAAPALITPNEATAGERALIDPGGNKNPKTRQALRPRGERGIILYRNKTKDGGERGIILQRNKTK